MSTYAWIFTKLFLGKVYLGVTVLGVGAIFVVHYYVMPFVFPSLWDLSLGVASVHV
jgi:hypothetical protein